MKIGSDVILVTGATGQQGGSVARELLDRGHSIRAMTRNPEGEKAKALAERGAEVVQGDLNDRSSLQRAVKGAFGVFAVQNSWEAGIDGEEEQGKRIAEVAREGGVQHFVYTSVGSAHRETGIPHFDNKWRVEQRVRELDFPSHTVIRPAFFMENLISPWFKPGIDEGRLAVGIQPGTTLQMIAVHDIGVFGAIAFERHEALAGRAIDIAGDQITMPVVAELLSERLGRKVVHAPPPIEEVRKFSEDFATMLEWFDRVGYEADPSGLEEEFGVKLLRFPDWVKQASWS